MWVLASSAKRLVLSVALACGVTLSTAAVLPARVRTQPPGCDYAAVGAPGGITGRITNAVTGLPLPNYQVTAFGRQAANYQVTTLSDATGVYTLGVGGPSVLPGLYSLRATALGSPGQDPTPADEWYGDSASEGQSTAVAVLSGTLTGNIDVALDAPAMISMSIDVVGAAYSDLWPIVTLLDAHGFPAIFHSVSRPDLLPNQRILAVKPGVYRLLVEPTSTGAYVATYYGGAHHFEQATPFTATILEMTNNIVVTLSPAAVITGVIAIEGGMPLQGARPAVVLRDTLAPNAPELFALAEVGAGGAYSVAVPPGRYRVAFGTLADNTQFEPSASVMVDSFYSNQSDPANAQLVTVGASGVVSNVNGSLRATGAISGFISEAGTAAPQNMWVTIYDAYGHRSSAYSFYQNEVGHYLISGLPPGQYRLSTAGLMFANGVGYPIDLYQRTYYSGALALDQAKSVTVQSNSVARDVNIALLPCSVAPTPPPTATPIATVAPTTVTQTRRFLPVVAR